MIKRRRRASRRERLLRQHAIATSRRGLQAIVEAVQEAIQPELIGHNCCVLTSRLLCDVLASIDVPASPISCILSVRNAAYCRLREHNASPPTASQLQAAGAAELVVADEINGHWEPRHLVVAARLDRWHLVDASVSQVARPERNIPDAGFLIEPLPLDDIVTKGGIACFEAPCGAQFFYSLMPGIDGWYKDSADWNWQSDAHAAYLNMIFKLAHANMTKQD